MSDACVTAGSIYFVYFGWGFGHNVHKVCHPIFDKFLPTALSQILTNVAALL